MGELSKLKGLGAKSEQALNEIGIFTRADLEKTGAIKAFLQLQKQATIKPSLNFLYAMVGALENRRWTSIAKEEKSRLLLELDGYHELKKMLENK